ncbi:sulfotransferase [Marinimicrobium koreense]|uniref:sulfotransferase n=1 Tax=Marinimicrobium koreense TaxID=306545 RepID=UPI003F71DDF8
MAKERIDIQALQGELEQALMLINESHTTGDAKPLVSPLLNLSSLANSDSLLERCAEVVSKSEHGKPKLRIIRHLACSGGTLISKCLAAMPNVFLLSELHPSSKLHMAGSKPKFSPQDVLTQARYSRLPGVEELAERIFTESVKLTEGHVSERGGQLIIRAHSHSDYCIGDQPSERCAVTELLNEYFDIKTVATVRDPVDSYLALKKNNWLHFQPKSFDEYCRRVLVFLDNQRDGDIFSYEKFVRDPVSEMRAICGSLDLKFDDSFEFTFSAFSVTGDSGRSGDVISQRDRGPISESFSDEVKASSFYKEIKSRTQALDCYAE